MRTPKFWPLDDDPEDPIYDSVAWDLPGYRKPEEKRSSGSAPGRSRHIETRLWRFVHRFS
jgi:hypothetical protein